jgi:hypothetical protein
VSKFQFCSKVHSLFVLLLQPLRVTGGTDFYSTLTGDGPIGQFYFYQGKLTSASPWITPYIGSSLGPIQCTTYGYLGFAQGGSTDKCARYDTFQIQSNSQNAQLGAKLTFNFVGDFYACGSGLDVRLFYQLAREE